MGVTNYHTINGRIVGQTKDGVRTHYVPDALGSVVATLDANGTVENTYRYKPYGGLLAKTGTGDDPRFLWTGSLGSGTTGLRSPTNYNRARHLTASLAAWTSVDPMWPENQPYVVSNANPALFSDPDGLTPIIVEFHAFIHKRRGPWIPEYLHELGFSLWEFTGNNRDFGEAGTSKLFAEVRIDSMDVGRTPPDVRFNSGMSTRRKVVDHLITQGPLKAPLFTKILSRRVRRCASFIEFYAEATYPFNPVSFPIVMALSVSFAAVSPYQVQVSFSGQTTWFPDFEAYVKVPAYGFFSFLDKWTSFYPHPILGLTQPPTRRWSGRSLAPGDTRFCVGLGGPDDQEIA